MVPDSPTTTYNEDEVDVLSVVVLSVVVLLSSLQEKTVRLKRDMRIMYKTLFIFSSIPKVKYYGLVLGEPYIYHNLEDFTIMWGFYLEGV